MKKIALILYLISTVSFWAQAECDRDSTSEGDQAIYLALIDEFTPRRIVNVVVLNRSVEYKDIDQLQGDLLEKFSLLFIETLYDAWRIVNRQPDKIEINRSISDCGRQITTRSTPLSMDLKTASGMNFCFSRIAYTKTKQDAIVYFTYDSFDQSSGGSGIAILTRFNGSWRLAHFCEISVH